MRRDPFRSRAFTLLEILISVVVLAFGLLGIVAVFPAVIDVQRRAQDAVIGGSSSSSAEAVIGASLLGNESLDWVDWRRVELQYPNADFGVQDRFPAAEALTRDQYLSSIGEDTSAGTVRLDFRWEPDWEWPRTGNISPREALLNEGDLYLGQGTPVPVGGIPVPPGLQDAGLPALLYSAGDRLLPDAASGAAPRYVWDAVIRRVDGGIGTRVSTDPADATRDVPVALVSQLPVEMAIFVRPIDRGIRVPAGLTLREVLTGRLADPPGGTTGEIARGARRFPVAASASDLALRTPGAGAEAGARYSPPIAATFAERPPLDPGAPNPGEIFLADLRFNGTQFMVNPVTGRRALAQVGQLFVDDLGTVHRVTGLIEGGGNDDGVTAVEIDPPLDPLATQIVYTPQVPADVRVVRTR
jgi:hypothetical protein